MIDSAGIRIAQGAPIACERIGGVNDNMSQSHFHDYYELYYLESGERYHVVNGKIYHVLPGNLMFFPPFVMHHSYGGCNTPFKRIVLYFKPDQIIYPELADLLLNQPHILKIIGKESIYIRRYLSEILNEDNSKSPFLFSNDSALRQNYIQSLLNTLMLTLVKATTPIEPSEHVEKIEQIVNYIHQFYNQDISLESLSKTFYMSPYHLCHEFKRYTRRTLVEYINITRIMNAQRKIMETNDSLTIICQETGFSNLTHFNRVFKQIANTTPSEYRKNYRQSKEAAEKSPTE